MIDSQRFPTGWNEELVQRVITDMDARTDDDWVAADQANATDTVAQTVVTVPTTLLPEIRRLLAAHHGA